MVKPMTKTKSSTASSPSSTSSSSSSSSATSIQVASKSTSQSSITTSKKTASNIPLLLLRCLVVDLPLMLLFASYIGFLLLQHVESNYLSKLYHSMEFTDERHDTEVTGYHYTCTPDDISTRSADDLILPNYNNSTDNTDNNTKQSARDAVELMQTHGATLIPDILSAETAHAVREFVLEENQRLAQQKDGLFYVIANENRFSFGIRVADHHVSIRKALHEIANHKVLQETMTELVGPDPAVIEFTAITSVAWAATQNYHQDVVHEGSAAKYARTFLPSYSLFMPLQDTTVRMGATSICAGTQLCANPSEDMEYLCEEHGLSVGNTSMGKWPRGWGALVNQQTTHRGAAHQDPNGPDRVVLIITLAPRPQFENNGAGSHPGRVESRMLGQSGSYSLEYRHWGFTLSDFGRAYDELDVAGRSKSLWGSDMTEPWRSLRAFGLYKRPGIAGSSKWGWDGVSVALMRMSNGDNGYTRDSLEDFVLEQGGFTAASGGWFPSWLQGDFIAYDEDAWEELMEEGNVPLDGFWYDFLVSTGEKVLEFLALCHRVALGIVLVGTAILAKIRSPVSTSTASRGTWKSGVSAFIQQIGRIIFTHAVVLGLAALFLHKIDNSHWARHVQSGKLFQPYQDNADIERTLSDEAYETPAFTLPNRDDVLVAPHYKSPYLAAYAKVLDFNQPGNLLWRSMVEDHAMGYDSTTSGMQEELCETLVDDIMLRQYQSRFLQQTEPGRWLELTGRESAFYCHKELMAGSSPLTKILLDEIEQLHAETKFGAWRATAMHRSTIPGYLTHLTMSILDHRQRGNTKQPLPSHLRTDPLKAVVVARESLVDLPVLTVTPISYFETDARMPLPPPSLQEPYNGAWFRVGDVVEAKYQGVHSGEKSESILLTKQKVSNVSLLC